MGGESFVRIKGILILPKEIITKMRKHTKLKIIYGIDILEVQVYIRSSKRGRIYFEEV